MLALLHAFLSGTSRGLCPPMACRWRCVRQTLSVAGPTLSEDRLLRSDAVQASAWELACRALATSIIRTNCPKPVTRECPPFARPCSLYRARSGHADASADGQLLA